VHIGWVGKLQSGHDGAGMHFSSSMSWTLSFSGTLDDLLSGKEVPKFDAFSASESWSYDIGGGCQTTAHLNPDVHTQGTLTAFAPGSQLTSGRQVPAWYQDSPNRKQFLVFGDFSFEPDPGPSTGIQAIPDTPDVKYGCDGFTVDGPSNQDDLHKTWTPYALFSAAGSPDASTPSTTSVSWNDSASHGQFTGQLTFSVQGSAGASTSAKAKPRCSNAVKKAHHGTCPASRSTTTSTRQPA
jgi:hypothetical protein